MTFNRPFLRRLLRTIAWLACGALIAADAWAIWQWTRSVAWRRTEYSLERERLTGTELWHSSLWRLHRFGWVHDDSGYFGKYGRKEECALLIGRLPRGLKELSGCLGNDGPPHLSNGLTLITNHDLGPTSDAWIDWWAQNKDRTQREWILDGFKAVNLSLEAPPTKQQAIEVFRRIGLHVQSSIQYRAERQRAAREKRKVDPTLKPPADALVNPWSYNAMRLLRDCEFDQELITAQDIAGPEGTAILSGMLEYNAFVAREPLNWSRGVVFAEQSSFLEHYDADSSQPPLTTVRWAAWAFWGGAGLAGGIAALGIRALWRSRRATVDFCTMIDPVRS